MNSRSGATVIEQAAIRTHDQINKNSRAASEIGPIKMSTHTLTLHTQICSQPRGLQASYNLIRTPSPEQQHVIAARNLCLK